MIKVQVETMDRKSKRTRRFTVEVPKLPSFYETVKELLEARDEKCETEELDEIERCAAHLYIERYLFDVDHRFTKMS